MNKAVFLLVVIVLVFTASALAGIQFTKVREFNIGVPHLDTELDEYLFYDYDNDGTKELIAQDFFRIDLFSISGDSSILSLAKDNYLHDYIAIGFWDDDSLLDFIYVGMSEDSNYNIFDYNENVFGRTIYMITYLSGDDYNRGDSINIYTLKESDQYDFQMFMNIKSASIINSKYTNEPFLFVRTKDIVKKCFDVDHMDWGVDCVEWISHNNFEYFPSSEETFLWSVHNEFAHNKDLRTPNYYYDDSTPYHFEIENTQNVFKRLDYYTNYEMIDTRATAKIYNDQYRTLNYALRYDSDCGIGGHDASIEKFLLVGCYWDGDFLDISPRKELVTFEHHFSRCSGSGIVNDSNITTPTCFLLRCYDLSTPDTLIELWRREVTCDWDYEVKGLFADESIPNTFFVFQNDKLYLRSSVDGELIDSSSIINEGYFVDYCSIDSTGQKYLILRNGSIFSFYTLDVLVSVDEYNETLMPDKFELGQPYPNPYNPTTIIPLSIPVKTDIVIEAYNILGQKVDEIYSGAIVSGEHEFEWSNGDISSGVYFIKVRTKDYSQSAKVVFMK